MKLKLKKLSKARQIALIAVGLLVAAVAGLFAYAEYDSSQSVKASDRAYSEARQGIYDQLSRDKLSLQGLADIKATAIQASDGLCDNSLLTQWRISSDQRASCQANRERLLTVGERAGVIAQRLEVEQAVAEVFDGLSEQLSKSREGDYATQKQLWSQAGQDLADISATGVYEEHLVTHIAAVKQIIKRHDGLIQAEKAQKRHQFDDAVAELQQAYEDLGKAKTDTQASYRQLTSSLVNAVDQL